MSGYPPAKRFKGQDDPSRAAATYYECTWRKPQMKKHKTWEGDAILCVKGAYGTLHQDNGNQVGSGSLDGCLVAVGELLTVGGREIEIQGIAYPSWADANATRQVQRPPEPARPAPISSRSISTRPPGTVPSKSAYKVPSRVALPKPAAPTSTRPSLLDAVPVSSFHNSAANRTPAIILDSDKESSPPRSGKSFAVPKASTAKRDPPRQSTSLAPISRPSLPKTVPGLASNNKKTGPAFDPDAPGAVVMKRPNESHANRFNKHNLPVVDVVVDPLLGKHLRPHQVEGVKFMYECVTGMKSESHGCILADEMGLGKTLQSIALVWTLLNQNAYSGRGPAAHRVVIVCPVSLVPNWTKEFRKWLGRDKLQVFAVDGKADIQHFTMSKRNRVLIIGYEKLRVIVDELRSIQPPIGLIICDEGHRLKGAGAKTTKTLCEMACQKRIILSGTPIQNHFGEYHTMVDFVCPSLLDSYQTFKKFYEVPITKSREPGASQKAILLGQERSETLNRVSSKFLIRRTAETISNYLPPKSEYIVFVAPTKIQSDLYKQIVGSETIQELCTTGGNSLVQINNLKKLCNSPGLFLKKNDKGEDASLIDTVKAALPPGTEFSDVALSGKLLAVASLLQKLRDKTEEKVVLVSNFTQTLDILEALCHAKRYSVCRLDGKTKQNDRLKIVDEFNRMHQKQQFVFLLSAKSGGAGLNIIGASRLIMFDSDWNPSTDQQAMARIHRDGQKLPCVIYRIFTTGTMDEKIFQRQITKVGLAGTLMENASEKSSDAFTLEELRAIFKFHDNTLCLTHDLLDCDCSGTGEDGVKSDTSRTPSVIDDEDDELPDPEALFVSASQWKSREDEDDLPKPKKKRLDVLKAWSHINCVSHPITTTAIPDPILRGTIDWGLKQPKNPPDQNVMNVDGEAERFDLAGGQVSFVFYKGSTKPKIT